MKKNQKLLAVLFLILFPLGAFAQDAVQFTTNASVRIRHEYWKNLSDIENSTKDNRNYFRIRTTIDVTMSPPSVTRGRSA